MGKVDQKNLKKVNQNEQKKLRLYKVINKQLSKKLADKQLQYRKCKQALDKSYVDIIKLQIECNKWKKMSMEINRTVSKPPVVKPIKTVVFNHLFNFEISKKRLVRKAMLRAKQNLERKFV